MNEGFNYVCSNCGARCGYDGRCGDGPYLVCKCSSHENTHWIDDGRGGYPIYLNDATPIHITDYLARQKKTETRIEKVGWRCPNCGRANAPDVKHCDCK